MLHVPVHWIRKLHVQSDMLQPSQEEEAGAPKDLPALTVTAWESLQIGHARCDLKSQHYHIWRQHHQCYLQCQRHNDDVMEAEWNGCMESRADVVPLEEPLSRAVANHEISTM